jgi:hypothetical protein
MSEVDQFVDDVRADESAPTSDQDVHGALLG